MLTIIFFLQKLFLLHFYSANSLAEHHFLVFFNWLNVATVYTEKFNSWSKLISLVLHGGAMKMIRSPNGVGEIVN